MTTGAAQNAFCVNTAAQLDSFPNEISAKSFLFVLYMSAEQAATCTPLTGRSSDTLFKPTAIWHTEIYIYFNFP